MNVYLVYFSGLSNPGQMLIVDDSDIGAFEQAKTRIDRLGLTSTNEYFSLVNLIKIKTDVKQVQVINDGYY